MKRKRKTGVRSIHNSKGRPVYVARVTDATTGNAVERARTGPDVAKASIQAPQPARKARVELVIEAVQTAIEAVKTINEVVETANAVVLIAAEPSVQELLRHIATAVGLGFQQGAHDLARVQAANGRTEDESAVEIAGKIWVVLKALKELEEEDAQLALRQIVVNGERSRDGALRDIEQIVAGRVRHGQDLQGAILPCLERWMLLS